VAPWGEGRGGSSGCLTRDRCYLPRGGRKVSTAGSPQEDTLSEKERRWVHFGAGRTGERRTRRKEGGSFLLRRGVRQSRWGMKTRKFSNQEKENGRTIWECRTKLPWFRPRRWVVQIQNPKPGGTKARNTIPMALFDRVQG